MQIVLFLSTVQVLFDLECGDTVSPNLQCVGYTTDRTIKLATSILIYVGVYVVQRFVGVIREKYVKNSIQQFVDICSIANVSVFMLLYESYGFYIHGRSPHGFSDTDMCSMMLQLRREENNLCGRRGLMLSSEQQTYSFLVPRKVRLVLSIHLTGKILIYFIVDFRILYDKLIASLHDTTRDATSSTHTGFQEKNQLLDKTASAYYNINRFLSAFIDHVSENHKIKYFILWYYNSILFFKPPLIIFRG